MIEVRLRHIDEAKAHYLTDMPLDKLDTVIPTLGAWGVTYNGDDCPTLYGQFVVGDTAAYFEVVVEP